MAGAFSAVGADFSATSLNPAGLGLYRKSDFMFTPGLRLVHNQSQYLGNSNDINYSRFGFSNVGYVYTDRIAKWNRETRTRDEAEKGLKSYSFSLGFNQLGQFGRNTKVSGYNRNSSITDYFAAQANGLSVAEIEASNGLPTQAWYAYAIDTSGSDGYYTGAAAGGQVQQSIDISEVGRLNEWTIGFGANVDDKIYFGGAIGIQDLKYQFPQRFGPADI
jgi:hypothetical protein